MLLGEMVVKGSVAVLSDIDFIKFLAIGVDIALVWFVFYKLIMIIRGTKAIQLLKGIIIVIVVWFISAILNLPTIQWIMNQVISWGFLAIIILFQPELDRKSTRLNSSHVSISYAVFCLNKKQVLREYD